MRTPILMTISNNINQIRTFYREQLETRIPFETHPLKDYTNEEKILYCTMLAAIVQYEQTPLREQEIFLERIVKGIELEQSVQQILQTAQTIDEEFAQQFYEQFLLTPIVHNFLVDALVMIHAAEVVPDVQLEFVAELADIFGLSRELFEDLVKLSNTVLTYKESVDTDMYKRLPLRRIFHDFEYLDSIRREDIIVLRNKCLNQDDVSYYSEELSNKSVVILKDCTIQNISEAFLLTNIHTLILDNCIIKDSGRVFIMQYVDNIMLALCTVTNIHVKDSDNVYGGLMVNLSTAKIYSIETVYKNIMIHSAHEILYAGGPIYAAPNFVLYARGNYFEECKTNGKESERALFLKISFLRLMSLLSNLKTEKVEITPFFKDVENYLNYEYEEQPNRFSNSISVLQKVYYR